MGCCRSPVLNMSVVKQLLIFIISVWILKEVPSVSGRFFSA